MTANTDARSALAQAKEALRRWHRYSWYPDALDSELQIGLDAILSALPQVREGDGAPFISAIAQERKRFNEGSPTWNAYGHCIAIIEHVAAAPKPTTEPAVPEPEYMSVTLSRDGTVTSHNAFDANFDEMVEATRTIIAALQARLDNRLKCPFASGKALREPPGFVSMHDALERLGSMEAFTLGRTINPDQDAELLARIDFARQASFAAAPKPTTEPAIQGGELQRIVHENGPVVVDWYDETLAWRPLDYGSWTPLATEPKAAVEAERERVVQSVWRCAIGDVVTALDILRTRWTNSRRKHERQAGDELGKVVDLIWAARSPTPSNYEAANRHGRQMIDRVRTTDGARP